MKNTSAHKCVVVICEKELKFYGTRCLSHHLSVIPHHST